jgi:uncharacterized protein (DUF3084 family)
LDTKFKELYSPFKEIEKREQVNKDRKNAVEAAWEKLNTWEK